MDNAGRRTFIDRLVDVCLAFLKQLTDIDLYTYQVEIAERLFFSLISGDAEEITVETARQSGKSECIADVAVTAMVLLPILAKRFPEDEVLRKFKHGMMVGCFAPTEQQAETIFSRIVDRLTSPIAEEIFADDEIDEEAAPSTKFVRLRNGSFCRQQTAHPKAKVESKTYHLIIIDEAQDADSETVRRRIHPMGAAVGGSIIKIGTPAAHKSDFYETIERNRGRRSRHFQKRCHFRYDWKRAAKENSFYAAFVENEKQRLGEDSDEFRMAYCVAPGTRLLTADLRYVPAEDLLEGDRLVGFDEERPGFGLHRRLRESRVEKAGRIVRPCYELLLSDGTKVRCSSEHRWLVSTPGRRTVWKSTRDLLESDRIFKVTDTWEENTSREAAYLAGAFDGEGSCGKQLLFSQRENAMLDTVRENLKLLGYEYGEQIAHGGTNGDVTQLWLKGGRAALMRFLGEVRPRRLLEDLRIDDLGSIGRHDFKTQNFEHPLVVKKTYVGKQDVIALRTSTRTFIAEGLASHNCVEWLLERGMFITEEKLERLADRSMPLVPYYHDSPIVIGLDVAARHDSTVATAVWVDWQRRDEFGLYPHRILAWLELHGENWESQYKAIVDFAGRYRVMRLGVDAQGMGGPVAERLQRLLPHIEVLSLAMNPKDQSERWQHLMQLLQREMITYPASPEVRKTMSYRRFREQILNVEKEYKGRYLLVGAPRNEKNAHDDYIDSLALACSLTKDFGQTSQVVQWDSNPFYSREDRRRRVYR